MHETHARRIRMYIGLGAVLTIALIVLLVVWVI